jgi:hypothetical protein
MTGEEQRDEVISVVKWAAPNNEIATALRASR